MGGGLKDREDTASRSSQNVVILAGVLILILVVSSGVFVFGPSIYAAQIEAKRQVDLAMIESYQQTITSVESCSLTDAPAILKSEVIWLSTSPGTDTATFIVAGDHVYHGLDERTRSLGEVGYLFHVRCPRSSDLWQVAHALRMKASKGIVMEMLN